MRILLTRTDRMGDVILTEPAMRHVRRLFPGAHIAAIVSEKNKGLLCNNGYLDEVIGYDKRSAQKGFLHNLKFIRSLRKKKFDLAVAFHPSVRMHLILFVAGIPRRIGYDRKAGFLLTSRIGHLKQYGKKHETEYNFELLEIGGFDVSGADNIPRIEVSSSEFGKIENMLPGGPDTKWIALHPGASCRSKKWPKGNFALTADALSERTGAEIVLVGDANCRDICVEVARMMKKKPIDLCGKQDLSSLGAVFSRCMVVVSNDSGPAHLAAAVGTPVVVIFGRNDPGLSPLRWRPLGANVKVLHSPPPCSPCLAHECDKDLMCMRNVSPEDVTAAVSEIFDF